MTLNLPGSAPIEYKYVKKDGAGNIVWENGANRLYTIPGSGAATRNDSWR